MSSERGIVSKDGIHFHQASEIAKQNLHYLHWGATYQCDASYCVDRDFLDAFIYFFILEGGLHFQYREKKFTAQQNQAVLLDCKLSNYYYADEPVSFLWFHFSGASCQPMVDMLYLEQGALFSSVNALQSKEQAQTLLHMLAAPKMDELDASLRIYTLLCVLFPSQKTSIVSHPAIADTILYMQQHYSQPLYLDNLSARVNFSMYHFSRLFKKETGISPHDYLLDIRIQKAKELLTSCYHSVETIGEMCGFNSTSHFIRAFSRSTGLTPSRFRKIVV